MTEPLLELAGEEMDVGVAKAVGDFACGRRFLSQQLCRAVETYLDLVIERGVTGHFFEASAKGRVPHSVAAGHIDPVDPFSCVCEDIHPRAFEPRMRGGAGGLLTLLI